MDETKGLTDARVFLRKYVVRLIKESRPGSIVDALPSGSRETLTFETELSAKRGEAAQLEQSKSQLEVSLASAELGLY